jgi:hypothetical protein
MDGNHSKNKSRERGREREEEKITHLHGPLIPSPSTCGPHAILCRLQKKHAMCGCRALLIFFLTLSSLCEKIPYSAGFLRFKVEAEGCLSEESEAEI